MSSPSNMKTGRTLGGAPENIFSETFYIAYLILLAILRRSGYKDCLLYAEHNEKVYNQELFDSGILFNLQSKYGVGCSLLPLVIELFTTIKLNPSTNHNNIFFSEIVRLTSEVSEIKRSHNSMLETQWMTNYAMGMISVMDDISRERDIRLYELLEDVPMDISFDSYDSGGERIMDISEDEQPDVIPMDISKDNNKYEYTCLCSFCYEFKKYHNPPHTNRNIISIIDDLLINITKSLSE